MVLKAQVKNGRLVLDEPTDLPEGKVVVLEPAVDAFMVEDQFSPEERAALDASIARGRADARADRGVDALAFLDELDARG